MKYAATALIVTYMAMTIARNDVWRSEQSLWADAAAKSQSPRAHINLGRIHHLNGNYQKAFDEYQLAAQFASERMEGPQGFRYRDLTAVAQTNLGNLLVNTGNTEQGERALQATLSLIPNFPPAVVALSHLRNIQGRNEDALSLVENALHLRNGALLITAGSGFTGAGHLYFERAVALCAIGFKDQSQLSFDLASRADADIRRMQCN